MRIALQSIWLGIIASVGLMIVAAFGAIPATAGALLQELVDLATIFAALRVIGSRRDPLTASDQDFPVAEVGCGSSRG